MSNPLIRETSASFSSATRTPRRLRWRSRTLVGLAIGALVASSLSLVPTTAALAVVPAGAAAPLPQTVSADVLPTPQINGVVWRVAVAGNVAYAVGQFTSARPYGSPAGTNEIPRNNAMAYDITTGAILPWNPNLNAQARAVQVSPDGTKLYVGGDFTTVSGQAQNKVAQFSLPSGSYDSTFKTGAAGAVRAIAVSNTAIYVGGSFASAGGQNRANLAEFNRSNGALLPWAPTTDDIVEALIAAPDNSRVIVGGRFQNMNGSPIVGIGAVDGNTGATQTWTSRPVPTAQLPNRSWVTDMVLSNGVVYASDDGEGGNWFDGRWAATFATGDLIWLNNCYGASYGTSVIGQVMYTVSHSHDCTSVGTFHDSNPRVWHRALADTTFATGTDQGAPGSNSNYAYQPVPTQLNWYPTVNAGTFTGIYQGGWSMATNGTYLVMGGEFTTVNGIAQQGLATFASRAVAPNKIGPVYSTATKPSVISLSSGTARIAFTGTWDPDDATLTYQVLRDNSLTPIYSVDLLSPFWSLPQSGFVDTGLTPGSTHTYRINIKDPWGNSYIGPKSDPITISSTSPSAYAKGVIADGASSYWPLNEASGSVVYDNAGFKDADAGTGVTRGASSAIPNSTGSTFDGTTNGMFSTRSATPAPNVFTAEAWFKTTSTSGGKIIGYGDQRTGASGSYDRQVYLDNTGRVTFGVYPNGVATIQSNAGYNDGAWHLVTASLGTDGMKLYIDGARVAQRSDVTVGQAYSGYWRVGGDNLSGWPNRGLSDYLAGTIDDVAIYPTVLAASTVNSHYTLSGRTSTIPTAPTDAYGNAVYQDGPDLYWRLDDATGTTAKDSGPANDPGVVSGTLTPKLDSAIGGTGSSFGFNGQDSLIASSQAVSNPTVYTVETWFKTTTTQGGKIIGFGDSQTGLSSGYDRHVYMQNDGKLVFGTYTGQLNTATSSASFNDGAWHYLVATQSSAGMQLYVDSTLVATNPQTAAQNYTGYWRIGGDNTWGSASAYFNGQIDETAVYSTALPITRIRAHYVAAVGPIANKPPTANFTSVVNNLSASFDASASFDPDGTIASYSWNYGDGSTGTGAGSTHTYATAGSYTVTLTVTDNQGAIGTKSQTIVTTAPPVAPTDAYGVAITADQPSLYWRLNEAGGTLEQDSSLNGNSGLISGTETFGQPGVLPSTGTAITFAGTDGVIAGVNAVNNPLNFSLETWFKTTTTQGGKLIGFGDSQTGTSNNYDRHVYMNRNGTLAFGVWTGQPNLATSTASYNDGAWHHLVATQSTTSGLVLYVDGAAVGTNPQTAAQPYSGYWRIGGDTNWGDGAAFFNGTLDESAVYNSVLTPTQVLNHYQLVYPPAPNVNPIAAFTSSVSSATAAFDGSTSVDPDGTVVGYAWNFGDGATGTGITSQHTYTATGTYTVSLTVTDNRAGTNTVTHPVSVTMPNVLPVAAFTDTLNGLNASFDASTSHDPDGSIASYAWTFGDGTSGTGVTPTHRYGASGTYAVGLTVTDNSGGMTTITQSVTVTNLPPVADFTSTPTNLVVAFDSSPSTDVDGTIVGTSWNFGDGGTATTAAPSHTYAAAGTYTVTLTVTDNQGATATATHTVTVQTANVLPVASFTATATGLSVAFNGSASNDPDGSIASYAWNFGDGSSGTGVTATHTYSGSGTFQATLTVTDNRGGTNTAATAVTVTAPLLPPPYAQDTFSRTTTGGFGTADVGGTWTTSSNVANFSVSNGTGRVLMAVGAGPSIYLSSVQSTNTEVLATIGIDRVATGGGVTTALIGRGTSGGDYRGQVKFLPNGVVTAAVIRATSAGVTSVVVAESTVTGLTYNLGDTLSARLQVTGTSPTTLRLKVWKTGTSEPANWLKTGTDGTAGLQANGRIGLFSYLSGTTTNAPTTALWDNVWVGAPVTP